MYIKSHAPKTCKFCADGYVSVNFGKKKYLHIFYKTQNIEESHLTMLLKSKNVYQFQLQ